MTDERLVRVVERARAMLGRQAPLQSARPPECRRAPPTASSSSIRPVHRAFPYSFPNAVALSGVPSDMPKAVRRLLPRLRDAEFTRLGTLPEATPVHEAARLQDDLLRAGIQPFAWVVNQSFASDGFRDPVLVERGVRELPFIAEVRDELTDRFALVSWKPEAPVGPERLKELARSARMNEPAASRTEL